MVRFIIGTMTLTLSPLIFLTIGLADGSTETCLKTSSIGFLTKW